jgi:hypothetical protein
MSHVMLCKFRLNEIKHVEGGKEFPDGAVSVQMGAVYEPDDAKRAAGENAIFGKYTPHGSYTATIYNPQLVKLLPTLLGRDFYIDFRLAE